MGVHILTALLKSETSSMKNATYILKLLCIQKLIYKDMYKKKLKLKQKMPNMPKLLLFVIT